MLGGPGGVDSTSFFNFWTHWALAVSLARSLLLLIHMQEEEEVQTVLIRLHNDPVTVSPEPVLPVPVCWETLTERRVILLRPDQFFFFFIFKAIG